MSSPEHDPSHNGVAVLASGGLDSAVLTAEYLGEGRVVQPIYVRFGLAWEETEETHLRRFLDTLQGSGLRPLVTLAPPGRRHVRRSLEPLRRRRPRRRHPRRSRLPTGAEPAPLGEVVDLVCPPRLSTIAFGTLKGNPFADSSREFFGDVESLVQTAVDHRLEIATPFSELDKAHVLELGRHLQLQHTFSCINPTAGVHCGRCNKCAERQRAFEEASIDDVTTYANL